MRYAAVPPGTDAQAALCGPAAGSVPWTPADRSPFRNLEASADKKVSSVMKFKVLQSIMCAADCRL